MKLVVEGSCPKNGGEHRLDAVLGGGKAQELGKGLSGKMDSNREPEV